MQRSAVQHVREKMFLANIDEPVDVPADVV
jgi:hypothetical protein